MFKKTGIHTYIYIKNLICNEIFLKEFLAKIFKLKWFDLIKVILDLAYDKNKKRLETSFIYINNDYVMKNASYFEIDSINDFNSENEFVIDPKEFYLNINFIKCFKIILNNNNEKMAIYFFKLLSYIIKKYNVPQFVIQNFKLEEYKQLTDFHIKLLRNLK